MEVLCCKKLEKFNFHMGKCSQKLVTHTEERTDGPKTGKIDMGQFVGPLSKVSGFNNLQSQCVQSKTNHYCHCEYIEG